MCAQLVVCPQRRPIFSTTQLGRWLPVPYYTQHPGRIRPAIHLPKMDPKKPARKPIKRPGSIEGSGTLSEKFNNTVSKQGLKTL